MISVVCVYNNKNTFKNFLLKSLKKQMVQYELIEIDNSQGDFQSAAQALNDGGMRAQGDYIMFAHQDVNLLVCDWLSQAENMLTTIPDLGIAGVIGVQDSRPGYKAIWRNVIKYDYDQKELGNPIYEPEQVQTLDECLIIIPKQIFNKHSFDYKTCNSWHLYAVDYCLTIRNKGYSVYVLPLCVWHLSRGVAQDKWYKIILSLGIFETEYYLALKAVIKKHKHDFKQINTSCGCWQTSIPLFIQQLVVVIRRVVQGFTNLIFRKWIK